jgi:hypothetical protein
MTLENVLTLDLHVYVRSTLPIFFCTSAVSAPSTNGRLSSLTGGTGSDDLGSDDVDVLSVAVDFFGFIGLERW